MFAILGLYFYSEIRLQALFYNAIILHYYIIILHYSIMLQALHMRKGLPVLTGVHSKLTSRTTSLALWSRAEEVPLGCHISFAQWPLSPVFPGLTYSHSFILILSFKKKKIIYLAAPGLSCGTQNRRSSLQPVGSLVATCRIFFPRPPALGAQSFSHWITRKVPILVL